MSDSFVSPSPRESYASHFQGEIPVYAETIFEIFLIKTKFGLLARIGWSVSISKS